MPYITQEDRTRIIDKVEGFGAVGDVVTIMVNEINKPGELNYAFTEMMINYLERKGISYTNMNEVIGVLECAKLELYRRMVVDYEDKKIEENGDVY